MVVLKERRLIPVEPVREGMMRLSFLLETCAPGTFPDPQLVAAVLDLVSTLMIRKNMIFMLCMNENIK